METVGHLDQRLKPVRKPERRGRLGSGEDGQGPCLETPELRVVDQIGERVRDRHDVRPRYARLGQLPSGLGGEVAELDPLGVAARGRIGRDVDGDARRSAVVEEPADLRARRDVGVQVHEVGAPAYIPTAWYPEST